MQVTADRLLLLLLEVVVVVVVVVKVKQSIYRPGLAQRFAESFLRFPDFMTTCHEI